MESEILEISDILEIYGTYEISEIIDEILEMSEILKKFGVCEISEILELS